MCAIEVERSLRCTEDCDAPATRVRELDEVADQVREALRRPDRIAGDDRDASDDLVRDERLLLLVEEVRLVAAEDEGRERVGSPGGYEVVCERTLTRFLFVPVSPRRDPRDEQRTGGGKRQQEHGEWEPVGERPRQVSRAGHGEPE